MHNIFIFASILSCLINESESVIYVAAGCSPFMDAIYHAAEVMDLNSDQTCHKQEI